MLADFDCLTIILTILSIGKSVLRRYQIPIDVLSGNDPLLLVIVTLADIVSVLVSVLLFVLLAA